MSCRLPKKRCTYRDKSRSEAHFSVIHYVAMNEVPVPINKPASFLASCSPEGAHDVSADGFSKIVDAINRNSQNLHEESFAQLVGTVDKNGQGGQ